MLNCTKNLFHPHTLIYWIFFFLTFLNIDYLTDLHKQVLGSIVTWCTHKVTNLKFVIYLVVELYQLHSLSHTQTNLKNDNFTAQSCLKTYNSIKNSVLKILPKDNFFSTKYVQEKVKIIFVSYSYCGLLSIFNLLVIL